MRKLIAWYNDNCGGPVATFIVLFFSAALIGWSASVIRPSVAEATVDQLRMTFESDFVTRDSGPVAGAIIGGMIAKTPGAIIGAAISNDLPPYPGGKLVACSFKAVFVRGNIKTVNIIGPSHGPFYDQRLLLCSLLRSGDKVKFRGNEWVFQ